MLISKNEYLHRLKKEIHLYREDLDHIENSWSRCAGLAEDLICEVPSIGILTTTRKRRQIHTRLMNLLGQKGREKGLTKNEIQTVNTILQYSSKDYMKATNASINHQVQKKVYPNGLLIGKLPILLMLVVLLALVLVKDGELSNTQIAGFVVMLGLGLKYG